MNSLSSSPARLSGVVSPETLKSLSGLEFLQGIIAGRFPQPPIAELMDFSLIEVAAGRVLFEANPGPQHYNPIGSVHGGFAATLLDSCMGCVVHSVLPKGIGYVTLEFKINFVRPITSQTGKIFAEGKIIHPGNRTATSEGYLRDNAGKLLAHASTTCLVFPL